MYRIELSPGEETAFRTIEELAVAIRRGVVTPRARVWHNSSGKWLPIQLHPHYKAAASMQLTSADLVAGAPVKPLELLSLGAVMEPAAPPVQPKPRPTPQPEPAPVVKRQRKSQEMPRNELQEMPRKKAVAKSRRGKSGGRSIRVALIGALLVGCAHLAFTAASAARGDLFAIATRTHRRLITVPAGMPPQSGPETTAAAVLPRLSDVPHPIQVNSAPAITKSEAATPPLNAFKPDSEPMVQPAPESVDIAAPLPQRSSALPTKTADSTQKKAMKGILRTISGTATESSRPRR
jgi:hypothetical protein